MAVVKLALPAPAVSKKPESGLVAYVWLFAICPTYALGLERLGALVTFKVNVLPRAQADKPEMLVVPEAASTLAFLKL